MFTIERLWEPLGRESDVVVSLTLGDLGRSDQSHLLRARFL